MARKPTGAIADVPLRDAGVAAGRRDFLKALGLGAAAVSASGLWSCAGGRRRPDIVLIMADDMGFSDIGCFGGEIDTPNIDRLAADGLRFTQFYNGARCCPTRASLLTGLYAHQTGIGGMIKGDRGVPGYRGDLNRECVTIAEVLRPAGYRTYMAGKWHVAADDSHAGARHNWPLQRGFDRFYGTITGAGPFFDPISLVRDNEPEHAPDGDYYYTDAIGDHGAAFIRDHAAEAGTAERPFFLYAAFTAPHWPLQAREEDIAKYKGRFDAGWDDLRRARVERLRQLGIIDAGWELSERDPRVPAWADAPDKEWQLRRMEVYAAMVDRMDQAVGRIVAALEEAGRLENTLILFLSDNGGCHEELEPSWLKYLTTAPVARTETRDGRPVRILNDPAVMPGAEDTYQSYGYPWANVSNTPFRLFKHWVHEGGISSPLVVHWPEVVRERGGLRRDIGHIIDVMATCVAVSGAEYPASAGGQAIQPLEGISLRPACGGRPLPERPIFWEHEGNRAVRLGRWKLVARARGDWELYDMEADRTELHDLAAERPQLVRELAEMWDRWAVRARVVPNG